MAEGNALRPFSVIAKSITGTTDSNGVLVTNLSRDDYNVLYVTSGGTLCLPYIQTGTEGGHICVKCLDPNTLNPRANTQFSSITIYAITM